MLTDAPPRNANRDRFLESDRIRTLDLPQDGRLLPFAKSIELAVADGTTAAVRRACADFVDLDEIEKELKKAGTAIDKAKTATANYRTRLAGLCDVANGRGTIDR